MNNVVVTTQGKREIYDFLEPNAKGERILVDISKTENSGLADTWRKFGFIKGTLENWWSVQVYVTDSNGNCWGKYNPTVNSFKTKLDFNWVLPATEANKTKILDEIIRRAFGEV